MKTFCAIVCVFFSFLPQCFAESGTKSSDILNMSLEDLMQVEVYSVSKKLKKIGDTPASIYVLDEADIRRSGATSLPEVLRLVPGVNVSQINAHSWAVSIRGSNNQFANKLQVLIDGQSVYSFAFSGVFWNDIDIPLEYIERIEVQRGPGGAIWGANAVNGVINIITKKSSSTQGSYVSAGGGNIKESMTHVGQGFELGSIGHGRVYAKQARLSDSKYEDGTNAFDGTTNLSGGFRTDLTLSKKDAVVLVGDVHGSRADVETVNGVGLLSPTVKRKTDTNTSRLIGKWTHHINPTDELSLQLDYINESREYPVSDGDTDTVNSELQYNLALTPTQNLILGVGSRYINDSSKGTEIIRFIPDERDFKTYSFFIQHDAQLVKEVLTLTSGVRVEHNNFTGTEVQPSVRVLGKISEDQLLWGAYSHAISTPSRAANDVRFTSGAISLPEPYGMGELEAQGNPDTISETLDSFELGYRITPAKELSFDISTFYFQYNNLLTISRVGAPTLDLDRPHPGIIIPLAVDNAASGEAWGGEISSTYNPNRWWRHNLGYAFIDTMADYDRQANELFVDVGSFTPRHSVFYRTGVTITHDIDLDATLRYMSSVTDNSLDPYFELDLRVAIPIMKRLKFSVVGQNLLHDNREEYFSVAPMPRQVPAQRGVYGLLTWEFE